MYGNVETQTYIKETQTQNPLNPYSDSKSKLEKYLLSMSEENKIKAVILRYFNVAGADDKGRSGLITNPDNLIKAICEVAENKRDKLIVNGNDYDTKDGTTIREKVGIGTVDTILDVVEKQSLSNPAIIVFGEVVNHREKLLRIKSFRTKKQDISNENQGKVLELNE